MTGVFAGLRVIDAASYVAAPSAATILGDFGASVVKLEPPGGDAYRMLATAPGQPPRAAVGFRPAEQLEQGFGLESLAQSA